MENYRNPPLASVNKFADENALWKYIHSEALALGQGAAHDRIINSPLYILTDDSQTTMWLAKNGSKTLLSFDLLDGVVKHIESDPKLATKYEDVLLFRDGIRSTAAYLQAARAHRQVETDQPASDPYVSPAQAWEFYIGQLGGSGLLGPDGAPIASLLGPDKVLKGLNSLASYFGASIDDIYAASQSNVHATLTYQPPGWKGAPVYSSQGQATYRFQPWDTIASKIADSHISIHLSDVLIVNPEAAVNDQMTVNAFIKNKIPQGVVDSTARGKALLDLRQKMSAAGITVPATGAAHLDRLRPLDRADTFRIVIPDKTDEKQKEKLEKSVLAAWQYADRNNHPSIEFVKLSDAAINPDISWKLLGSTAVFLIDPSTVEGLNKRDIHASKNWFVRLVKDFEINGTVGEPVHGQTPTFVIGDARDLNSGAGIAHQLMDSLYIHGKAKNPIEGLFSSLDGLPNLVSRYWKTAPVRPADSDLTRIASPLAEPLAKKNEVVIALYGSAKELVDPRYPAQIRQVMNAAIEAYANKNQKGEILREPFTVEGASLISLGKQLGVTPPPEQASVHLRTDYYKRLDAAINTMPGVEAERKLVNNEVQYLLRVPVMKQPVVFSHGGGVSPFDARQVGDPTTNIMGAFNGLYLARIEDENTIKVVEGSNRGITTLPLEQKEGRETLLPTNERIYTDHIQQRTLETQRGANVAFVYYGGIGTEQEKLYFPGLIVLVQSSGASNSQLAKLRETVGLKTITIDPASSNIHKQYRLILKAAAGLNPRDKEFDGRIDELQKAIEKIN